MPEQKNSHLTENATKKNTPVSTAKSERSIGFLWFLVSIVCIFLMLLGTGTLGKIVENQLPEIYGTALTLCLSCIGLGEINFKILGSIAVLLILTLMVYKIVSVISRKTGGQHGK